MFDTVTISLRRISCCECGLVFAVPVEWDDSKRHTGHGFKCPDGHGLTYGLSDLQRAEAATKRAQELLSLERTRHEETRSERDKNQRKLTATRGYVTRIKNRVSAGVCPCCNRTFSNLARHMKGKHPDYAKEPAHDPS